MTDPPKSYPDFCDGCCYRVTCTHDLEKCCYLSRGKCLVNEYSVEMERIK